MTATPAKWAGVIAAAEQLAAAVDNWENSPRLGARRLAWASSELLAELANLWTPAEPAAGCATSPGHPAAGAGGDRPTLRERSPAVAEVLTMKFTGADRGPFEAWLAKCQQAGAARTMTDAIRLAVRLASSIPAEQLAKTGAGNK